MAGPWERRGRLHKFLSRYNIVVVYKPGVEKDAADGMSRWAWPAGLAYDTNFHCSDADLEGVTQWDASEREKEQHLIAKIQYPRKALEVRAPKGRPSPQDMQEQRERDHLLLQVNRLHNSVHYDSSLLPDTPQWVFALKGRLLWLARLEERALARQTFSGRGGSPKPSSTAG